MGMVRAELTLIYCDSRKRDSTVAILIKEFLSRSKQLSFISSRRNLSKILKLITPVNIVIIGQINILYDLIYSEGVLKNEFYGMNIYFYPSEGYAMEHEYRLMYPERYDYNNLKKIFFWGGGSLDWVKRNININRNILDKTGYPRNKMAKVYASMRNSECMKIGFIGRFPILNDLYGVLPMQYILEEFSKDGEYQALQVSRLEAEGRTVPIMLRIMKYIVEETNYRIGFRPHPNEDRRTYNILKEIFGSKIEISEEVDVAEYMAGCDKIVGLASSSYIDASLVGVPIICIDKLSNVISETEKYEPALKLIYDVAYLPETFDELKVLIKKDISIKKSKVFDDLIKTDFIGDYNDPIFHVAKSVQFTRKKISTYGVKVILYLMDALLIAKVLLKKSSNIDFDYSSMIHKKNKRFIDRYINSDEL